MKLSPPPPLLIPSALSQAACGQLILAAESGSPKRRSYQGVVDRSVRDCVFVVMPPHLRTLFGTDLLDQVERYFGTSARNVLPTPVIYLYSVGVGFAPHHDLVTPIERERGRTNGQPVIGGRFTCVAFLADPTSYDGGELYFPDWALSYKPAAGDLVVFPTSEAYIHGVAPVTRGRRATAVWRLA